MTLSGYLVVRKPANSYKSPPARFVVSKPSTDFNEIAIKIECTLPDELFTRPQLKFAINVPKEAVPQQEITSEVIGNIKDIIQQNTGLEIKLIAED